MDQVNLLIVLGAAIAGGLAPGPGTLAIAGTAMARGRAMGLAVAWGMTSASIVWASATALGFGQLMVQGGPAFEALRLMGVCYLLWLAWHSARAAFRPVTAQPSDLAAASLLAAWLKGFGTHATNPKAVIYWGSILAIGIRPDSSPEDTATAVIWVLGLSLAVNIVLNTGYALLLSSGRAMRFYARAHRWLNAVSSCLFGAAAMLLLRWRSA